jgi:hypothetical protein
MWTKGSDGFITYTRMNKQGKIILETRKVDDETGEYLVPLEAVVRILEELEQDLPDYMPTREITEGMVLRALRKSIQMPQREVEMNAKLPLNYLNRIEKNSHSPSMGNVIKILGAMGMDLKDYDRMYKELLNENYEVD